MRLPFLPFTALACGLLAVTASAGPILLSDNFNAQATDNLDLSDQTGRRMGLTSEIQVRSSRIQHGITSNQLNFLTVDSGRIRFHDDPDNDVNTAGTWHNWAGGTTGAQILADGGLRIEFDWNAGNNTSTNWVSINVGHGNESIAEPATRVNEAATDIGFLLRFDGRSELFDNAANLGAQGNHTPTIGLRHVSIEYRFASFADGTPVSMIATVDGTEVFNGDGFTWDSNLGEFYFEIGTLENTMIDNLRISTTAPDGFEAELDGNSFFSSLPQAALIGTLSAANNGTPEDATFSLVSGVGDTDNGKFQINGDRLEVGSFDFLNEPDGTEYSIRVLTDSDVSAATNEQVFTVNLVADSDADALPDIWELATAGNRNDLSGLGGANFDGDTLTDLEEWQVSVTTYPNINPLLADTDDDGLEDGSELAGVDNRPPTDPTLADTDGDSLTDMQESNTGILVDADDTGSNPTVADTDGDLYPDAMDFERGGDPNDALLLPLFSPGVSKIVLTDDASTEIDASKTYTHTVSGAALASVNSVEFEVLGLTATPANLIWDTGGFTMAEIIDPVANPGAWLPVDGGVVGPGLTGLLGTFTYSGTGPNAGAVQTFTLNGLSPGQSYSLRLYVRVWDTGGSGRPVDLSFSNGAALAYAPILEDRPGTVIGGGASQQIAYMIVYDYVAAGSELSISAAIPAGAVVNSGSFHLYGLSNETGGSTPPNITDVIYDSNGPRVLITFDSVPGQNYKIDYSTDLTENSWFELSDNFPSEGTTSTYIDTQAAGLVGRVFYRISVAP